MSDVVGLVEAVGDQWQLSLVSRGKHRKVVAFAVGKPAYIREVLKAALGQGSRSVRKVQENLLEFHGFPDKTLVAR